MDVVRIGNGTTEHPGGRPANIAVGLGQLGVDATLMPRFRSKVLVDVFCRGNGPAFHLGGRVAGG